MVFEERRSGLQVNAQTAVRTGEGYSRAFDVEVGHFVVNILVPPDQHHIPYMAKWMEVNN